MNVALWLNNNLQVSYGTPSACTAHNVCNDICLLYAYASYNGLLLHKMSVVLSVEHVSK